MRTRNGKNTDEADHAALRRFVLRARELWNRRFRSRSDHWDDCMDFLRAVAEYSLDGLTRCPACMGRGYFMDAGITDTCGLSIYPLCNRCRGRGLVVDEAAEPAPPLFEGIVEAITRVEAAIRARPSPDREKMEEELRRIREEKSGVGS